MNFILDTNVISELVSPRPAQRVLDWVNSQDENRLFLSVITVGDLCKGIEKLGGSARKTQLSAWLHEDFLPRFSGRILDLNVEVMLSWGQLLARLESLGKPSAAIDSLLAATALHHGYAIVTRNTVDFTNTEVSVVNPWVETLH